MPIQGNLFEDPYAAVGEFPDNYPKNTFTPPHRLLGGTGTVVSGTVARRQFFVDMNIGECNCDKGYAHGWDDKRGRWYSAAPCPHKLRFMSVLVNDLIESGHDPEELRDVKRAYLLTLAARYNPFEAVSAFHKELRRGDFKEAWFWGLIVSAKRGMRGLFKYMLNIIYEETRDHELADYLLRCSGSVRMQTLATACKAISWFCATPKKWELPRRYAIFEAEMRGYKQLVKDYGRDVAKGSNIIPDTEKPKLLLHMQKGAEENDLVRFQRGLKGLQKLQYLDHPGDDYARKLSTKAEPAIEQHRYWLYSELYDLAERKFSDTDPIWNIFAYVNRRMEAGIAPGYHELNCLGDAITGEPYDAGLLPPDKLKRACARPSPGIPVLKWPPIPLYAHDSHTWGGKRLMRMYPDQLKPGAHQTDLDFRGCGAYWGVCYRMLIGKQFPDRDWKEVEFHEVTWPKEIYNTVDQLWY